MELAGQEDSSELPGDSVPSSHGRQSMAEGLKGEAQNRISNLQRLDHPQKALISKEDAEDSDVDSGHNSIDRQSLATETSYRIHNMSDIPTDYGRHSTNIWIDSAISSGNNYVVDVGDSVVYHDPIRPTEELNCEEEESEEAHDPFFTTVARKKSVFIKVDKWTTEAATVREIPSESQVKAGSISPEVTYAKVNKKKSCTTEDKEGSGDVPLYSVVNKEPQTKRHEGGPTNLDIGDADDLYAEVYQDQNRNAGENLYARVGGKVMIVSDDGDYASVKSLTDSDSSRNTQVTVLEPPGHANQSSKTEDASLKRNLYAVQYLGSVPVAEEDLSQQRCTATVAQCISQLSQHSSRSHDNSSIYEWPMKSRMFLQTCESKRVFTLLSSDSVSTLDEHFLYSIRFWAVGKEANSKHFAYVIRNASRKHVCRVFLCDVAAKHIAGSIRNICQQLAVQHTEMSKRRSVDSTLLDNATEALNPGTTVSAKTETKDVVLTRPADGKCPVIECCYIGVIKVTKAPGKDVINSAADSVFKNISKEKWARVDVQLSPTSITIKELKNTESKSTTLPTQNVIYLGTSTKNKKLSTIFVRSVDHGTFAHVFHCEPHAKDFIKQIEATCEISSKDENGKSTNQPLSQQQGKKGMLSGKSKG